MPPIRLVTCNVLHPKYAERYPDDSLPVRGTDWSLREEGVIANLRSAKPDLLFLQEVDKEMANVIKERLGLQGWFAPHAGNRPDGVALFYSPDCFTYVPREMTTQWDQATRRATLVADLHYCYPKVAETAEKVVKIVRAAVVHAQGGERRELGQDQTKQVLFLMDDSREDQRAIDVKIVAGDFNEDRNYQGSILNLLEERGYINDGSTEETEIDKGRRIDWIYINGQGNWDLFPKELSDEQRMSDHRVVASELRVSERRVAVSDDSLGAAQPQSCFAFLQTCWDRFCHCLVSLLCCLRPSSHP